MKKYSTNFKSVVVVENKLIFSILPKTAVTLITMPKNKLVNSYFFRGSYSDKPTNRVISAIFPEKIERKQ